ncbi:hypothetical protein RUM44_002364 [Polyplax serrata]|uniref:Uncharacterized protein n=1 Tax=Polyplax serrata TaxID=468196 RepID=A0ABR1AND6_POLSC
MYVEIRKTISSDIRTKGKNFKNVLSRETSQGNDGETSGRVVYPPFATDTYLTSLEEKKDFAGTEKALTRRQVDGRTDMDFNGPCRSFILDMAVRNKFEFYSPGHMPNQVYPSQMDCVKTITAVKYIRERTMVKKMMRIE